MKKVIEPSLNKIRWKLFLLGLLKIPLLHFVRPKLIFINSTEVQVQIKLRRRTKNHLNSMYFGALTVGADVAAGIHAFYFAEKLSKRISFSFKSMHAEFIKRAETTVDFYCEQGGKIENALIESAADNTRKNIMVDVTAINSNKEKVAIFKMELSLKVI